MCSSATPTSAIPLARAVGQFVKSWPGLPLFHESSEGSYDTYRGSSWCTRVFALEVLYARYDFGVPITDLRHHRVSQRTLGACRIRGTAPVYHQRSSHWK